MKLVKRSLAIVIALVVVAFAIRAAMVWNKTRDVLPTFVPIPDGPRAPPLSLGGYTPGLTQFDNVKKSMAQAGYVCRDTSMRGLMQQGRSDAQTRIAEAKERGDDPKTVSGASRAGYYSSKEQNPQIVWSCDSVDGRPAGAGLNELLSAIFVFDSATHPLRHITISRRFMSQRDAHKAFERALATYDQLGEPTFTLGEPNMTTGEKIFERLRIVTREWRYADRTVAVSVMNTGPRRGIDVREVLEVPWPVTVNVIDVSPP